MSWIDAAASPQGKASLRGSAKKSSAGNLAGGGNRRPLAGEMTFMNVTASSEGAGSDEEMKNRIARRKAVERTRKRAADMQALALQEEKSAREKKNRKYGIALKSQFGSLAHKRLQQKFCVTEVNRFNRR